MWRGGDGTLSPDRRTFAQVLLKFKGISIR